MLSKLSQQLVTVYSSTEVDGYTVRGGGIAATLELAARKAQAELVERIYSSDLSNTDLQYLVTYKQPSQFCSTGAAAHTTEEAADANAKCELVERDTLVAWLCLHRTARQLFEQGSRLLVELPCAFSGYYVVVCIRTEGALRELTAGCASTLEAAMEKAWSESHLRPALDARFIAERLPPLLYKAFTPLVPQQELPELAVRRWYAENLYIVKFHSYQLSNFHVGLQSATLDRYKELAWRTLPLQTNWFF